MLGSMLNKYTDSLFHIAKVHKVLRNLCVQRIKDNNERITYITLGTPTTVTHVTVVIQDGGR